jgi:predicted nucleotidyltransferase
MDRRRVAAVIARHADDIKSMGVRRLYLFGSTARGEAGRRSDVDIFIDVKPGARFSLFDLMELRDRLSKLLGAKVDVFSRDGLHRIIRRTVEREAIRVI